MKVFMRTVLLTFYVGMLAEFSGLIGNVVFRNLLLFGLSAIFVFFWDHWDE